MEDFDRQSAGHATDQDADTVLDHVTDPTAEHTVEHGAELEFSAVPLAPVQATGPSGGTRLREAREERGLSVEKVAAELRLKPYQVQALEDENFTQLPEPTYVCGYVRQYAKYLQLPSNDIVDAYPNLDVLRNDKLPVVEARITRQDIKRSGGDLPMSLVVFVILFIVGSSWYFSREEEGTALNDPAVSVIPQIGGFAQQGMESAAPAGSTGPLVDKTTVTNAVPDSEPTLAAEPAAVVSDDNQNAQATPESPMAAALPSTETSPVAPVAGGETAPPVQQAPQDAPVAAAAVSEPVMAPVTAAGSAAETTSAAPPVDENRGKVAAGSAAPVTSPKPAAGTAQVGQTADAAKAPVRDPMNNANAAPKSQSAAQKPVVVAAAREKTAAAQPVARQAATNMIAASKLVLTFKEDSWSDITDARGRRVMYKLGRAGTQVIVNGVAPFKGVFGYMTGITMQINGEAVDLSPYSRMTKASIRIGNTRHNSLAYGLNPAVEPPVEEDKEPVLVNQEVERAREMLRKVVVEERSSERVSSAAAPSASVKNSRGQEMLRRDNGKSGAQIAAPVPADKEYESNVSRSRGGPAPITNLFD